MARFKPGHKKIGGRKAGTPNKFTTLKNDWIEVHARLGGVDGLLEYARAHKGWFYTNQTKLFPQEVAHSGEVKTNNPLIVKVIFVREGDPGNGGNGDKAK